MSEPRLELPRPVLVPTPTGSELASDYLRTLLFSGVLRTGDKVPIDEIASVLRLSRQPIREALIELAHDGLVRTDSRRGTFVAEFGPATIRDHYELYGVLQSFALRRVAVRADPEVLATLRRVEAEASRQTDVDELARLGIEFARIVNRAAGNSRLRVVIRSMSRMTPGNFYLANVPGAAGNSGAAMRAQLEALESGDPDAAARVGIAMWAATGEALVAHLYSTGVFTTASTEPNQPSARPTGAKVTDRS